MKNLLGENNISFILKNFDSYYPLSVNYDESKLDVENIINLAERNNVLFFISNQILSRYFKLLNLDQVRRLKRISEQGEDTIKSIGSAIAFVNRVCPEGLYIKTYRAYPRIPSDLDVYTKEFENRMNDFEKLGLISEDCDFTLKEVAYFKDGVKLHLHGRVAWLNRRYFDSDLLIDNPRTVLFAGQEIKIPGPTMDLLIHLAHINFEPMHFTLSDMVYIFILARDVDWVLAEKQARKYHWYYAFSQTLGILNNYHRRYYGINAAFPSKFLRAEKYKKEDFQFNLPRSLPRLQVIFSFLQKGVILEPILKIKKVVKVLLTGDSYQDYYVPAEKKIDI